MSAHAAGLPAEFISTSVLSAANMGLQVQPLVSASWLANMVKRNLVGPSLRVLDSSWYLPMMNRDAKKEFAQSHIPGASLFDIDECSDRTSKFDHTLPSEQHFADYVGNLGIGNDSHVVVYDVSDYGAFSCTRVWWMFRLFGHPKVSVLNGGFRNWVSEGHPVSVAYTKPEAVRFKANMNRSWVKSFEDVRENILTQRFQVVDARPHERFRGVEPEPREGESGLMTNLYLKIKVFNICQTEQIILRGPILSVYQILFYIDINILCYCALKTKVFKHRLMFLFETLQGTVRRKALPLVSMN